MARWEPWGGCVVVSMVEDKTPQMPWGGCVVVSMMEYKTPQMPWGGCAVVFRVEDKTPQMPWGGCAAVSGMDASSPSVQLAEGRELRWSKSPTSHSSKPQPLDHLRSSSLLHLDKLLWVQLFSCIYLYIAPPPKKKPHPYAHALSPAIQAAAHQLQGLFGFEVQEATVLTEGRRGRQETVPFWRGMGVFSRNCVCFQWVLALAGPVLK